MASVISKKIVEVGRPYRKTDELGGLENDRWKQKENIWNWMEEI